MGLRASVAVAVLAAVAGLALPSLAAADVQHTIGRGHTIEAIANRYHVTAKAIIEANHLKDVKHLRVGEVLTIPGVKDKSDATTSKAKTHEAPKPTAEDRAANAAAERKRASTDTSAASSRAKGEKIAKVGKTNGRETTTFAMKAKTPGVIHVHRIATTEQFDIHVGDKKRPRLARRAEDVREDDALAERHGAPDRAASRGAARRSFRTTSAAARSRS